jgi:arylsulfatase A-like enzyme
MRHATLIAALLMLAPVQAMGAAPKEPPPNLLVVITDDQAAENTLEVMPQTRRRIGRQGVTFRQAHVTTPKCCPSRATFFTGRYVHNHGVISNSRASELPHDQTIHYLLQREGYRTAIFGKFLNSWPVEIDPPFFDEWAISNGGFEEGYWNINSRVRTKEEYTTDLIADRAVGFIRRADRRNDEQPWLAWVTPHAPHHPSVPARRHRSRSLPSFTSSPAMLETDWSDKPDFLEAARNNEATLVTVRDDGRRSLLAVDEMVGRLLDEIKARREVDNTLVVFTSDNGFMFGEHGGVVGKDLPYPASTRVPLLARWPGHFRPRRTNTKFVTNIDVAATMLEAAGLERETDGRSLLAPGRRSELFVESRGSYNEDGARALPAFRSVTTRGYRYAEYYRNGSYDLLFREYYDLYHDPWELQNVVTDLDPARIGELSTTHFNDRRPPQSEPCRAFQSPG